MSHLNDIVEQSLALSPELHVHILALAYKAAQARAEGAEAVIEDARKWLNFAATWTSPTKEEAELRSAFARSLEALDSAKQVQEPRP